MMHRIAIGLAALTIVTGGSVLTASALPSGVPLGIAQSVDDGAHIDKVYFHRGFGPRGFVIRRGFGPRFAFRRGFGPRAFAFRRGFRRW